MAANLFLKYHDVFDVMRAILENRLFTLISLNFLLSAAFEVFILVKRFFFGEVKESENREAFIGLKHFFSKAALVICVLGDYRQLKYIFNPTLVFCQYFNLMANVKINSFNFSTVDPSKKSHKRLFLLHILIFFTCLLKACSIVSNAKRVSPSKYQYAFDFISSALNSIQNIIKHFLYLNESLNDSASSYQTNKIIEFIICFFKLIIQTVILSKVLTSSNLYSYFALSFVINLAVCIQRILELYKWKKMCKFISTYFDIPTEEEIAEHDICIICRMKMSCTTSRKLHCGHIFHLECLRLYVGGSTQCPLCKKSIDQMIMDIKLRETQNEQTHFESGNMDDETLLDENNHENTFDDIQNIPNEEEIANPFQLFFQGPNQNHQNDIQHFDDSNPINNDSDETNSTPYTPINLNNNNIEDLPDETISKSNTALTKLIIEEKLLKQQIEEYQAKLNKVREQIKIATSK